MRTLTCLHLEFSAPRRAAGPLMRKPGRLSLFPPHGGANGDGAMFELQRQAAGGYTFRVLHAFPALDNSKASKDGAAAGANPSPRPTPARR